MNSIESIRSNSSNNSKDCVYNPTNSLICNSRKSSKSDLDNDMSLYMDTISDKYNEIIKIFSDDSDNDEIKKILSNKYNELNNSYESIYQLYKNSNDIISNSKKLLNSNDDINNLSNNEIEKERLNCNIKLNENKNDSKEQIISEKNSNEDLRLYENLRNKYNLNNTKNNYEEKNNNNDKINNKPKELLNNNEPTNLNENSLQSLDNILNNEASIKFIENESYINLGGTSISQSFNASMFNNGNGNIFNKFNKNSISNFNLNDRFNESLLSVHSLLNSSSDILTKENTVIIDELDNNNKNNEKNNNKNDIFNSNISIVYINSKNSSLENSVMSDISIKKDQQNKELLYKTENPNINSNESLNYSKISIDSLFELSKDINFTEEELKKYKSLNSDDENNNKDNDSINSFNEKCEKYN
eukprot:jgi/Orpsp1_1/1176011/evm.model.c7180000056052.1